MASGLARCAHTAGRQQMPSHAAGLPVHYLVMMWCSALACSTLQHGTCVHATIIIDVMYMHALVGGRRKGGRVAVAFAAEVQRIAHSATLPQCASRRHLTSMPLVLLPSPNPFNPLVFWRSGDHHTVSNKTSSQAWYGQAAFFNFLNHLTHAALRSCVLLRRHTTSTRGRTVTPQASHRNRWDMAD